MYIFLSFVFNSVTSQTWIVFHYLTACSTMPVLIVWLHKSTGACSVDTVIILLIPSLESVGAGSQGCGLGLDISVSRRSRDVSTSRLGLVSTKIFNVSVSSRSRPLTSRARDLFSTKFCRSQY